MNRSNYDYEETIEHFGKEKIINRYNTLSNYLKAFIERNEYQEKVKISFGLLNQALIDYFADVDRLKNFHHIDKINYIKIHAYTAYWLLRRKPIQIIQDDDEDTELAFINENFVASYLIQFLIGEDRGVIIKKANRLEYEDFVSNLKYVLRYRLVTPQLLETILEGYQAGRIFERSLVKGNEI